MVHALLSGPIGQDVINTAVRANDLTKNPNFVILQIFERVCAETGKGSQASSWHPIYPLVHLESEHEVAMSSLAAKTCVPCRGGVPPLKGQDLAALHTQVPEWQVMNEHHITRQFKFPDFKQALAFVNRVGELAEEQGHHPDILLTWGKAEITLWTHKIDGLTESDFIMAAKIDRLLSS
jgi:4a-hydroxytetrahydrobiopterin dehydratase